MVGKIGKGGVDIGPVVCGQGIQKFGEMDRAPIGPQAQQPLGAATGTDPEQSDQDQIHLLHRGHHILDKRLGVN